MRELVQTMKPVSLLTVYDSGYIDYRDVLEAGKVSASRPLYQETINDIFANLRGDHNLKRFEGVIPNKMVYVDPMRDLFVWTRKAEVRELLHTTKKHSGKYAIPTLVFRIEKGSVSVVAIKKLAINSPVYIPPFTNTANGDVCMGSASLKTETCDCIEDLVEYAENQFYNSYFTHSPTEYQLLGKGKSTFPKKELKAMGINLKQFING